VRSRFPCPSTANDNDDDGDDGGGGGGGGGGEEKVRGGYGTSDDRAINANRVTARSSRDKI